jgi:hypothetical protein
MVYYVTEAARKSERADGRVGNVVFLFSEQPQGWSGQVITRMNQLDEEAAEQGG